MKVGNIELSGVVFLAPMAGVTNLAYREFMKPFGVALTYSEMISDCGLIYGNKKLISILILVHMKDQWLYKFLAEAKKHF